MAKTKNLEKWGKATAKERYGNAQVALDTSPKANDLQAPQDIQDKHAAGYDNQASGWVRGMGKNAPYPHFDSGASGQKFGKGK